MLDSLANSIMRRATIRKGKVGMAQTHLHHASKGGERLGRPSGAPRCGARGRVSGKHRLGTPAAAFAPTTTESAASLKPCGALQDAKRGRQVLIPRQGEAPAEPEWPPKGWLAPGDLFSKPARTRPTSGCRPGGAVDSGRHAWAFRTSVAVKIGAAWGADYPGTVRLNLPLGRS